MNELMKKRTLNRYRNREAMEKFKRIKHESFQKDYEFENTRYIFDRDDVCWS